ncbi:MAG TPA: hypothetical protein VHV26_16680 [Rhizomicrobium sp.]|jgi:hypothetical protein|nr:hypothetical protein [Rhizomicrobium sp.]
MAHSRVAFALLAVSVLAIGATAAPLSEDGSMFSNLCRSGGSFSGSRLTLTRDPHGDSGVYQWGDTAAATAPLDQLAIGADGKIAFRYMPDADNPEVVVQVTGTLTGDAFDGKADGKPLHIPRTRDMGPSIPACK